MSLKERVSDFLLERRYGLDTSEHVGSDALGHRDPERYRYEPSGWLSLRTALPRNSVGPSDVFADLGSGKGRVVFQAALRYPFARVIGVELAPELNAIAHENIERNRHRLRCPNVELVTADVLDWEVPHDLTIAYLHNPFLGGLFSKVVERLTDFVEVNGRPLRLIYVNPVEHDRLMATGRARELAPPEGLMARLTRVRPDMIRRYEIT